MDIKKLIIIFLLAIFLYFFEKNILVQSITLIILLWIFLKILQEDENISKDGKDIISISSLFLLSGIPGYIINKNYGISLLYDFAFYMFSLVFLVFIAYEIYKKLKYEK